MQIPDRDLVYLGAQVRYQQLEKEMQDLVVRFPNLPLNGVAPKPKKRTAPKPIRRAMTTARRKALSKAAKARWKAAKKAGKNTIGGAD